MTENNLIIVSENQVKSFYISIVEMIETDEDGNWLIYIQESNDVYKLRNSLVITFYKERIEFN